MDLICPLVRKHSHDVNEHMDGNSWGWMLMTVYHSHKHLEKHNSVQSLKNEQQQTIYALVIHY